MKTRLIVRLLSIVACVLLFGCSKQPASTGSSGIVPSHKPVTFEEAQNICLTNADQMMLNEISNDVIGFHSIIQQMAPDVLGNQETNWEGFSIVDYINKVGRLERTNLYYKFWTQTNQDGVRFYCHLDHEK